MSYYLLFILIILGLVYTYQAYRSKKLQSTLKSIGLYGLAGFLALGLNATPLLSTSEYSSFSTRSGSELTLNIDGSKKNISYWENKLLKNLPFLNIPFSTFPFE